MPPELVIAVVAIVLLGMIVIMLAAKMLVRSLQNILPALDERYYQELHDSRKEYLEELRETRLQHLAELKDSRAIFLKVIEGDRLSHRATLETFVAAYTSLFQQMRDGDRGRKLSADEKRAKEWDAGTADLPPHAE